ncbi:MAG: CotS family spore coat protein [Roseburia sp.]|nr:CotS family spore coat protein [Roseburia sp.]
MNDRTVAVLEQYDMEVSRTFKGRGTLICDTDKGMRVLKEYKGKTEKLELLSGLQQNISDSIRTDRLVRSRENELFVRDADGSIYILKEQVDGRECSYKNEEDIVRAFDAMARLHLCFTPGAAGEPQAELPICFYGDDMEKHTRECRHVRNYLRKLRVKTDFERALLREYDYFLEKACAVTELVKKESRQEYEQYVRENGLYCHGDYQYHNVVFPGRDTRGGDVGIVNFEHFAHDSGARDFYLLFRKISEKSDWSIPLGEKMLDAYRRRRTLAPCEWRAVGLRLAYPEKFWKIINFYQSSRKSWMPNRNFEKLDNLIRQERHKEKLIRKFFGLV